MPIQTSCFEKSKFQSTQATNFGRLLGIAVQQCDADSQRPPKPASQQKTKPASQLKKRSSLKKAPKKAPKKSP